MLLEAAEFVWVHIHLDFPIIANLNQVAQHDSLVQVKTKNYSLLMVSYPNYIGPHIDFLK